MANPVTLRSREQILGDLIRTILINSDLTDVAPGSTLSVLLEAVAASIYEIEVSTLKILESSNLESLTGADLDKKAEGSKLPNGIGGYGRKPSAQAIGPVTIGSSFSKISTKLYAGKPAPFSGQTTLYLENASSFPKDNLGNFLPGYIYIGRNTVDRFEGKIYYSSLVNSGSYYTMVLSSPITKSHLHSDLVVYAQGGDRSIQAGTVVQVPANSDSTAVQFKTVSDLLIPDGEAEGTVNVACIQFGEVGNALADSITEFSSSPFSGATVTNPSSFRSGKSSENDEDLRQRIKAYPSTLSRGTKAAILAAITGATDPESGRTIQNAIVLDPVEPGDFARVYIDDNTGLEPTFGSQAYELLLQSAAGQETRFRAAQFPVTPATIEGANSAPFVVSDTMTLTVRVDEISETYTINPSNYISLSSASAYELVRDLNSQSNIVGFRTLDGGKRIVMTDLSGKAEEMEVSSGDLQLVIGFPLAKVRPIFLYKNAELLSFRGHTASLTMRPRNAWPSSITLSDVTNVRVKVDGVIQTFSVSDADFASYGTTMDTGSINQWAEVLSKKVAGVKFTVSGQDIVWSSWQTFSPSGSLEIMETKADGSSAGWIGDTKMWTPVASGGVLSDVGATKDYSFNRFTGEINLINKPDPGDMIEISTRSTRAHIRSKKATNGLFSLGPSATVGNSRLIVGFDGEFVVRTSTAPTGSTVTATAPDSVNAKNVLRLTANVPDLFLNSQVGDYFYLSNDSSTSPVWATSVEGFYRIKNRGHSIYATDQIYSGVSVSTSTSSSLPISVSKDKNIITVTHSGHGLKTGDLITTSASSPVGGISAGNLSVTNSAITVLSSNSYQYVAGGTATSDGTGTLTQVGSNVITVTQVGHGFSSGALIDTTSLVSIGGITSGNLSVSSAPITVISADVYKYRALSAATSSATGTLSVTYKADCWVEFEVSGVQYTNWSSLFAVAKPVTSYMFYIFKSTVLPQLVDFGALVSTMTVDQIVDAINNTIVSGTAVKLSPEQLDIRSNDFQNGTCAILASIGNASNLFDTATSLSIQPHAANSPSAGVNSGFPIISSVVLPTSGSGGYSTRTYLVVDKDLTDITSASANPSIESDASVSSYPIGFQHLWLTGRQSGLTGRVYNNQVSAPYTGVMRGEEVVSPLDTSDSEQTSPVTLDRYSNYGLRLSDLPINNNDKLVVEMDLDPTDKTVAVSMAKLAKIQDIDPITGSGPGQVISFRLKDPEDSDKAFFDSTSVYKDYDFSDFKMLTKSVALYRELPLSDRALVLRSSDYGAPNRLRFSLRLPTQPDQSDFVLTHSSEFLNGETNLNLVAEIPSQSLLAGSLVGSDPYKVVSSVSSTLYNWRVTAGSLNSTGAYTANRVLNISGSSSLAGSYPILSSSYLSNASAAMSVTPGSNVVNINSTGHGLSSGDMIAVSAATGLGGIPQADLSSSGKEIPYIDPNNFSYIAASSAPLGSGVLNTVQLPTLSYASVSASSFYATNLTINTTIGSYWVKVTHNGHGLKVGYTPYQFEFASSASVGGISAGSLSTTTTINVLNSNEYEYSAASPATSTATGTAVLTSKSKIVKCYRVGHGFAHGDSISVVKTGTPIDGLPNVNLTGTFTVIYIDADNFQFASSYAGYSSSSFTGTIDSITRNGVTYTLTPASVTPGSATVTVTQAGHTLITGQFVNVTTSTGFGGLSAANLSSTLAYVTYIDPNTFTYNALAIAPAIVGTGLVTCGIVTVKSPGSGGLSPSAIYDAASSPIRCWQVVDKTWQDLATAINGYLPEYPVAAAEAVGTNFATNPLYKPTFVDYPSTLYTASDMSGAFNHHSFNAKMSGSAGIWQYDSSNPLLNNIKATVQSNDSIFPTVSEASGTSYSPINEEVYLVPTNAKSLASWLAFKASSSLNLLADVERIAADEKLQISSKSDGSSGAVSVTGVSANGITSSVFGSSSASNDAASIKILTADAKAILKNSMVRVKNTISSEIFRAYRNTPAGSSITTVNTTDINSYFRPETAIKYVRVNSSTGRLIFYRHGMGPSQTEQLASGATITLTNLGSGLVQVTRTSGGTSLSARVGDMMYIQPSSPFNVNSRCEALPVSGDSDGSAPEYLGYPVVHVIDSDNIIVIAPNITSFGPTVLTSSTDLVFIPAVYNEKNIRTNHKEGAKFKEVISGNKAYYFIKSVGNGVVSLWMQNSSSEATDDMLLDNMSVNTDDYVTIGDGFDPVNQGTFKILAHNGRNHILYYNAEGGKDETIDADGDRKWRVGPIEDGINRALRIVSSDSVRIGDYVRISSPVDTAQWFGSSFFGSWKITKIGLQSRNYTGYPLPHISTDGTYDQTKICPYIEFEMEDAPLAITDSLNNPVDSFLIGNNKAAIGFTEGSPFEVYRMVSGHVVDGSNPELSDLYLVPKYNNQKMSDTFGTVIEALEKIGFDQQAYIGIDGYKIYTGPIQQAHRIIDGLPQNSTLFPGVKAAGASVEVNTPLIRSVRLKLQVSPKDGVTLNSISDLVKSATASYVNGLGVGKPVVLSEIIRAVQSLPGVFSVVIVDVTPAASDNRIIVADSEKAYILDVTTDVIVG